MGALSHGVHQETAFLETHVPRRRADETAHRMFLHVFGHVIAQELHAHDPGELLGQFGLAHARGPREQKAPHGPLEAAQARTGELDGSADLIDGGILAEEHILQFAFQIRKFGPVIGTHRTDGNPRHPRDHGLNLGEADSLLPLFRGQELLGRTGFIQHIDGLVGELRIPQVPCREPHRSLDGFVGELHAVVGFVVAAEPFEDPDAVLFRGLAHIDLLETPCQRAVPVEGGLHVLVRGGADATQLATG